MTALTRYKYHLIVLGLILLTVFLRLDHFTSRWGLSPDDSRDAMIGMEGLRLNQLPLIGSFSSAGPFVFGPLFYWLIMGSYATLPFTILAPWITTLLAGIALVGVFAATGYYLGGKRLAIVTGLLAATSPQLVMRSTVLTQHSYVAVFTALAILFLVLAWQKLKRRGLWCLLFGLSVGTALSMHYQALNLIFIFPVFLLLPKANWIKRFYFVAIACIGFVIPALPLLLWDSKQEFSNLRNIADFFLIAQHRFYVPSSWKLFLFNNLPSYWAFVTGGFPIVAQVLFPIVMVIGLIKSFKDRGLFAILFGFFSLLLILNRYYKGERFEGYLIYLAPFIIILTASAINWLWQKKKAIGLTVLSIVLVCSLYISLQRNGDSNNRLGEFDQAISVIEEQYPNRQFLLYDQSFITSHVSQPFAFLMGWDQKTSPSGYPIGFCKYCSDDPIVQGHDYMVVSLEGMSPEELKANNWSRVNKENMFDDLIGWSVRNKLPSSFFLERYIQERLPFFK